jgi:hypothetical protein
MILYDTAYTSLVVEQYILKLLGFYKRLQDAKDEKSPGENIYKVTIEVEELD